MTEIARGDGIKATYNSIGQMVAEKWYNVSNTLTAHYKYVYDGQGSIVRCIDILQKKEYTYTYEDGRIIRAAESDITLDASEIITGKTLINSIVYSYDSEGKLIKKRIIPANGAEQTIWYENSDDNTVVKFTAGGKTVTSHYKTDSFGRKVFDELQLGTGFVSRQFHYHAGDVTDEHKDAGKLKSTATTQLVSQIVMSDGRTISYEYDAEERITKVTDSVDGTTEYTYDALGQLLTEKHKAVNADVFTDVNSMEYDNYGNILSKNGIVYTYGDGTWKDLLTKVGTQTISYDKQGNPTSYLGHNLTWEKGRQLKSFDSNTYTYNANGIRTSKTVNGVKHTYTLDGSKILRETWGDNVLVPLYDNEDAVCGILYNNEPYYFQKNLQGDIIAIADKDARVVAKYTYDAWGVCTVAQDTSECGIANVNPFRYRGYYFDSEIGLYYLQSRYFNPQICRFLSSDDAMFIGTSKIIVDCNIFAYCYNTPTNAVDHLGNLAFLTCVIVGAIVGAVIGVSYSAYKGYIGGKTGWDLAWHILKGGVIGAIAGAALGAAVYGVYYAAMAIGAKLTAGSCGTLGKVIYSSWQKAEQALRNSYNGISKAFNTPYGKRIIDSFSRNVAREAKYGYQGLSQFIQNEINKDAWLLRNGYVKAVEWHFYVSQITSKGGPSAPLLKELLEKGFKVIYH